MVEGNGGLVDARHHQLHSMSPAQASPGDSLIHYQTTDAPLTVRGSRPHGDQLRTDCIIRIEKRAADAAGGVPGVSIRGEVQDFSLSAPIGCAFEPIGIRKLRLFGVGRAEGARSILERAKASGLED